MTVEEIYGKIWELSPNVHQADSYAELTELTKNLISLYDDQGRLISDPFGPTRLRQLSLPFDEINRELKDSICLITGGLGCVGSTLLRQLLKFDVKRIIILDAKMQPGYSPDPKVTLVTCDVREYESVKKIFERFRPHYVFHTAAQRDPGLAEMHIYDTVSTNILGTLNVVRSAELSGSVKQCIFSSTGKASRYLTEEIYAGTKKVCEYILESFSKEGNVKYGMVRFTHILDNSLMNKQLLDESEHDEFIAVHCPGKFVTAQNVEEAATLILNALVYSENQQCNFLLVKNLEWPVESLEMALYYIKRSGRAIPIIFKGNPIGYTEKFFRGQMDWAHPQDLNLLINVYEQRYRRYNKEDDIIISHISPINKDLLKKLLQQLEKVKGEQETKKCLIEGLKEIVADSLEHVNKDDTVKILHWGLDEKVLSIEKTKISDYGPVIPMMFESLKDTRYYAQVEGLLTEPVSRGN